MKVYKDMFGDGSKINASEIAVNPNALLGDTTIVETLSNSNGVYMKFGNGIMIQTGAHTWNRTSTRDAQFDFPAEWFYTNISMSVSGYSETSGGSSYHAIWDGNLSLSIGALDKLRYRIFRDDYNYKQTGNLELRWAAVGFWKAVHTI